MKLPPQMEWSEACTLGKRTTADLWSLRANAPRNSHCAPTVALRLESTNGLLAGIDELRKLGVESRPTSLVQEALEGLKFATCVPRDLALEMLRLRLSDPDAVSSVLREPVVEVGRRVGDGHDERRQRKSSRTGV